MYQMGHCGQCGIQIMVKAPNGTWNSRKPIYRNIDVKFADGHLMRAAVCSSCADAPDYTLLMQNITCPGSDACSEEIKEELSARGTPVSHIVRI